MTYDIVRLPAALGRIMERTAALGFGMACEARTGALLRALAATKPGGRLIELGTGTGVGTAWLLDGMSSDARLVSIDNDAEPQAVAREALGTDSRLELVTADARDWLLAAEPGSADLVFADTWAGKFEMLERSLGLLRPGGLWVGDDLLPQPNWPDDHAPRVPALIEALGNMPDHAAVTMAWASGVVLAVRRG